MARRTGEVKPLPYKIYIGDQPWDDMTPEERARWGDAIANRLGQTLSDCFSRHPEEYVKVMEGLEKQGKARRATKEERKYAGQSDTVQAHRPGGHAAPP